MKKFKLFKLLALFVVLITSINTAWAAFTINGGTFYFDNSKTDWGQVALFVGKGGDSKYTSVYSMNKITNTKLYYYDMSSWGGATYIRFTGCTDWGSGSWGPENYNCSAGFTAAYTSDFTWNSSQHYLHTTSDGNDNATITPTHKGNTTGCIGSSAQTINVIVNGATPGTAPADIDLESAYWTAYNAVTQSTTQKIRKGKTTVSDEYSSAAYTAKTTLSVGTPTSGYYFLGWYDSSGNLLSASTSYTYYPTAATTITARFEQRFSVTVNAGSNGTTTPSSGGSVTAGYYTSAAINASANPGYYFTGWSKNNNNVTFGSSTTTASNSVKATGTATVTASFAQRYILRGSKTSSNSDLGGLAGWDANNNDSYTSFSIAGNVMTITATLTAAKTRYKFKIYDRSNGSYKGQTGTDDIGHNSAWTLNGSNDVYLTTTAAGVYTFNYNFSTNSLTVLFPTAYTVTYSNGTGGSSITAEVNDVTIGDSPGYAKSGADVVMTATAATGYTFSKWVDGSDEEISTSNPYTIENIGANTTIKAVYTPNEYTLTFHLNGGNSYDSYGDATNDEGTVTYVVTYDQVLNDVTLPYAIKNAYHFDCWSTSSASSIGSLWEYDYNVETHTTSIGWKALTNYVIKDGDNFIWKKAANVDLYAIYLTPFEPTITFTPEHAVPEGEVEATLRFSPVAGGPEGTYIICYMLTTAAGVELRAQPEWKNKDDATYTVSFNVPASPGDYSLGLKVFPGSSATWNTPSPVVYFDGNCTGVYASNSFDVEEMNAVTVSYKSGDADLQPSTTAYATWINTATITAPEFTGLQFVNWTFTGGASLKSGYSATDKTIEVRATGTGTATANYSQGPLFFKNTKNWSKVYIYFYKDNTYLTESSGNDEGTGSNSSYFSGSFIGGPYEMTVLDGTTDVYYYDGTIPKNMAAVAFAKDPMENYNYFTGEVVRVAHSINPNKPMIVPVGSGALWNRNTCRYYGHDEAPILMDWGYNLRGFFNNWGSVGNEFKSAKLGDLTFTTTVYLDTINYDFQWKIYKGTTGYGKTGGPRLTYDSPTSDALDNHDAAGYNLLVKTNYPGEHTFTLNYGLGTSTSNTNGASLVSALTSNMKVTVTYPVKQGDYRLVYTGGAKAHPGNVIQKRADGEDIVSMYVEEGKADKIKIQSCSSLNYTSTTWGTPADPTYSSGVSEAFTTLLASEGSGVYNFYITQDGSGNPTITNVEKYSGRFYVRTNCVDDKWNYKLSPDKHAMTYSEWSATKMEDTDMRFSHYFVDDLHGTAGSPINISFTVATDYSDAICDTVLAGDNTGKWKDYIYSQSLTRTANVRFTYDQARNKIWRAYTEGPENDNYMVLRSNGTDVFAVDGSGNKGDASAAIKFADMNNWIYQADAYANVGSYIKLTADINDSRQYIKGESGNGTDGTEYTGDDGVLLVSGTGGLAAQHMRIIYDFKTDRMMTSWLPAGPVDGELDINADIMLIRKEQEGAGSVTFEGDGILKDVKTAYGVMQFTKAYINDYSYSRYARNLYWISFPFDVNLSDVFGFGKYGEHWIIEYYDGKGRAQKGFWAESEPNWKFVTEEVKDEFVLKANEGYILALALSNMGTGSDIWANSVTSVYLYFPSAKEIGSLAEVDEVRVQIDTVGYKCNITRDNRTIKDSYWHCIGAPSYAQSTRTSLPTTEPANWETKVPYLYTWNNVNNSLSITSSSSVDFLAMHSYLVQYPDDVIVWTEVTNKPAIMRRRVEGAEASFYEWNLNLMSDGQHVDHTYVRLTNDENATDGFDFGNDLSKEFNSGSNIYTFVDGIEVAGNVKPIGIGTTVVPVGVQIAADGEYTFAIPDGTNGVGIVLVDNIAGTRTNLALEDYVLNLTAGQYSERFFLEISPITQSPTDVEAVSDQQSAVRKVMIDGILYIVKDGIVYDACGNRVK